MVIIKAIILAILIITSSPWIKTNSLIDYFLEEGQSIEEQITYIEEYQPELELYEISNKVNITSETPEESLISEEILENIDDDWTYSASCIITHYCNCAKCCGKWAGSPTASGVMPTEGRTVAVDKSIIPLGSEVLINGYIYVAEDTGVSGYWVDIYVSSHSEAEQLGMYTTNVKWR